MIKLDLIRRAVVPAVLIAAFAVSGDAPHTDLLQAGLPSSTLLFAAGLLCLMPHRSEHD